MKGVVKLDNCGSAEKYYDYAWSKIANTTTPQETERIKDTISLIPGNVCSIIDIGCGDGRIINELYGHYKTVCGLDSSEEALKHVITDKVCSGVESIPFQDGQFDLVLCCEVLEHLAYFSYPQALTEIERVASKYIIVTVPNDQDLKASSTTCPYCGCVFDPSRHVRSYNLKGMENLFKDFEAVVVKPFISINRYPGIIYKLQNFLSPIFKTSLFPKTAICPQCGYCENSSSEQPATGASSRKDILLTTIRFVLKLIPKRKKGIWLIGLYKRKEPI